MIFRNKNESFKLSHIIFGFFGDQKKIFSHLFISCQLQFEQSLLQIAVYHNTTLDRSFTIILHPMINAISPLTYLLFVLLGRIYLLAESYYCTFNSYHAHSNNATNAGFIIFNGAIGAISLSESYYTFKLFIDNFKDCATFSINFSELDKLHIFVEYKLFIRNLIAIRRQKSENFSLGI